MTEDFVSREEWEALHMLARASGQAPGPDIVMRLERRGLIDDFALTDFGKALHSKFAGAYPPKPVRRSFIGRRR